jgi:hypothetical protein
VDILNREISINDNDDAIVLKATSSGDKCIFLAYITAHATIYSPMGSSVRGFTWKWLEENCSDILALWGFGKKRSMPVFWSQTFLQSTSWRPNGQLAFDEWLKNGGTLLEKIFIAKPLDKDQRYALKIKKHTKYIHLPDDVNIKIIPGERDTSKALGERIPFENEDTGTDNIDSGSHINNIKPMNDTMPASNDTAMESTGIYPDTRSAIQAIANEMPEVEEVVFVAYVGKLFADDLKMLKSNWEIKHLCFLLRDPDAFSPDTPGEIPCDTELISDRKREYEIAIKAIKAQARHTFGYSPEIKYYRSQPCLRGMLVKKQYKGPYLTGFMNIYEQSVKTEPIDYAARNSAVIKLSNDNDYEKVLLVSFSNWFEFVREHGSYSK